MKASGNNKNYDIFIKGATLVDGTGTKPFKADIAVKDGLIAEIALDIKGNAINVINAEGKIVTPGFIDVHRHADSRVLDENFGEVELRQGITTIFSGNCGLSLVPCPEGKHEPLYPYLEPIMGRMPWDYKFNTFQDYVKQLEKMELPINFGCFIGNNTTRIAVKGFERGSLTEEEKEQIRFYLAEGLSNGARGVSLGIMYVPENSYCLEDYRDIFRDIKRFNPILVTHIRGEGNTLVSSVAEVIDIAKNAGVALHISHLKAAGGNNWNIGIKKALKLMDDARDNGLKVTCDVYPYEAGSTLLVTVLPPEFQEGGTRNTVERLKDKAIRSKIKDELHKPGTTWDNILHSVGWGAVMISSVMLEKNMKYLGKTIKEIAEAEGKDEYECAFDLIVEEEGKVAMIYFIMSTEDVKTVMQYEHSIFISDSIYPSGGLPHPRLYGAFPKFITKAVKYENFMNLETVVAKMTSKPADIFGITNKGRLASGYDADINIFDLDKLKDNATYTKPVNLAEGFSHVIVNGSIAIENDMITGTKSGRFLRK